MTTVGFNKPLYILPFDHRGSFQVKMFGWKGALTPEQTGQIAVATQVIYDGFKAAVAARRTMVIGFALGMRILGGRRSRPMSSGVLWR